MMNTVLGYLRMTMSWRETAAPAGPASRIDGSRNDVTKNTAPAQKTPAKMWIRRSAMVIGERAGLGTQNDGPYPVFRVEPPAKPLRPPIALRATPLPNEALRRRERI